MFQTFGYPSLDLRKALTREAIFYLGTNVRKQALYQDMAVEIETMREALVKKCGSPAHRKLCDIMLRFTKYLHFYYIDMAWVQFHAMKP